VAPSPGLKTASTPQLFTKRAYPPKAFGMVLLALPQKLLLKQSLKVWWAPSRVIENSKLKLRKEPCKIEHKK